jgi:hypothetical protein
MSPPNFTVGTMLADMYHSSLQITCFQLSTVQWCHSLHHFRRHLAFTSWIFGLWAAARPWNPIPLNSRCTVMVLDGQFVALRNSWVIVSLMSGEFHKPPSTLNSPCRSLNAAYPVMVLLWLYLHISTSQSHHQLPTWAKWEGLQCPWEISYWCDNQQLVHIRSHWVPLTYPCCWYCLVMSNA